MQLRSVTYLFNSGIRSLHSFTRLLWWVSQRKGNKLISIFQPNYWSKCNSFQIWNRLNYEVNILRYAKCPNNSTTSSTTKLFREKNVKVLNMITIRKCINILKGTISSSRWLLIQIYFNPYFVTPHVQLLNEFFLFMIAYNTIRGAYSVIVFIYFCQWMDYNLHF